MAQETEIKLKKGLVTGIKLDDKWIKSLKLPLVFFTRASGHTEIWDGVKSGIVEIENKEGEMGSYILDPRFKLTLGKEKIPYYDIHENDFIPQSPARDPSVNSKLVRDWAMSIKMNEMNKKSSDLFNPNPIVKWIIIIGVMGLIIIAAYMLFSGSDSGVATNVIANGGNQISKVA